MWLVEELENSIDIVELVSRYTKLKKAGANYKAHCPFPGHTEKTPSFVVSPAKQLAYCFGCHKWGWALKFVMDIENMEFKDAIQVLASITWKKLEWFDNENYKIKKNIYSLYKDATNYYKKALGNNPEAQKYLYDRWLKKETIIKFEFGFSDSGIALYNYLKEKWYEDNLIKESSIFVNVPQRKDKFIWRIIFPIKNLRWDIVAFTARILNSWEPKYLNSPASKYYDKSEILYGLYEAKKAIVDKDFVIIVEWQMDVIAMQEAWFINTVAVSWTALTDKHLQNLKRLTHKIYICFDWDKAGQKATKLAIENTKNKWFEINIITLPKWKDPDEILKSWKDFNEYIKSALSPIAYYINNSKFEITSIEDKKKLLLELLEIVKNYTDPIERDFYLKEIAEKLDLKENLVWDSFNKIFRKKIKFGYEEEKINKKEFSFEEIAIWYILLDEKNKEFFKKNLIFQKTLIKDLKDLLNWELNIINLPLDKRDEYKAIALQIQIEQETDNETNKQEDLLRITKQTNLENYRKITKELKQKMKDWDDEAFIKYNEIIKKAKEYNLK